jgi:hypothetical protein
MDRTRGAGCCWADRGVGDTSRPACIRRSFAFEGDVTSPASGPRSTILGVQRDGVEVPLRKPGSVLTGGTPLPALRATPTNDLLDVGGLRVGVSQPAGDSSADPADPRRRRRVRCSALRVTSVAHPCGGRRYLGNGRIPGGLDAHRGSCRQLRGRFRPRLTASGVAAEDERLDRDTVAAVGGAVVAVADDLGREGPHRVVGPVGWVR